MYSMEYDTDVYHAAKSHPNFDKVNAKEISDSHNEGYETVLKDIQMIRERLSK